MQESIGTERPLSSAKIILPLQSALTPMLPNTKKDAPGAQVDLDMFTGFAKEPVRIMRFESNVDVMASKEKPKKLTAVGSDGRKYNFLCKMERKGDLRKDARLMETNSLVNR